MSTLKLQSNPFLVHGRSNSDNHYLTTNLNINHLNMPRTYSPPITNNLSSYIGKKRKFDDDLLITPANNNSKNNYYNNNNLITPPRTIKRPKTVPSSPTNNNEIYETPKTPSFKKDFNITLGNSKNLFSPTSPNSHLSLKLYSNSSNSKLLVNENVTPPQSVNASPKQKLAVLSSPTILPSRKSKGSEYAYIYPDTCYPFNIGGSAIGRSEGNLRLETWREACNEKVRHEYNKSLKEYNILATKLNQEAKKTLKESPNNLPQLSNENIFPSASRMSKIAFSQLNYPFINNNIDKSKEEIEQEAELLLNLKNNNNNNTHYKKTANYPLKFSPNIQLPPITEILKYTPFDKSTIHPSGLSTLEINQYQNPDLPGFIFERNSKLFYNGREIKKNILKVNEVSHCNISNCQTLNKNNLSHYSINNYNSTHQYNPPQLNSYSLPSSMVQPIHQSSIQAEKQPSLLTTIKIPQLESPIRFKYAKTQGANAYDDLSNQIKDLSDNEDFKKNNIKQFQTQFKTQNLKVSKTRRNSVFKITKTSIKGKNKSCNSSSKSSTSSSRKSSRSSSRKSSCSNSSIKNLNSDNVSNVLTTGYEMRTRSSSLASRTSTTDSVKTAEVPASVETTPKSSPSVQKSQNYISNTNNLLFQSSLENNNQKSNPYHHHHHNNNNKILDFSKSTILSLDSINPKVSINEFTTPLNKSVKNTFNHTHNHHQSSRTKKCMSCFSSSSPCWRPSWSPEEGQLCNSCGLRYRKTKARCFNPSCLKIPSKSEWALMVKRGEVLLDIYDSKGNIIGKKMSYRCLDCDSAMEVLR